MTLAFLRKTFFRGLIAVLPIAITAYLLIWLVGSFESIFRPMILVALPEDDYIPGLGVLVGLIGIFLVGLLLKAFLARRLWKFAETILARMPLVSQVYDSLKQVVSYVGGNQQPKDSTAVLVRFGDTSVRMLGLVTREQVNFVPDDGDGETVAVFLPWSYQVGGITVLVPRNLVEPIELSARDALRFSLTAGVEARQDPDGQATGADRPDDAEGSGSGLR